MLTKPDGAMLNVNGDGYGVGWYSDEPTPCVVKGKDPIWNNDNLKNICHHTSASLFMAHVRLTTTGTAQRENSHPFSHENWLFQHNGFVSEFPSIRRALQMEIAPELYPHLKGTTDSETFFLLALTYGLKKHPKKAIEKLVERLKKAVEPQNEGCFNLSCVMSDGEKLYTVRTSHNVTPHTQFYSTSPACMQDFTEDAFLPKNSALVVSEPLNSLSDNWQEVPPGSFVTIAGGVVDVQALNV